MNQKDLTKTVMIMSNLSDPFISMVYSKVFQRFKG